MRTLIATSLVTLLLGTTAGYAEDTQLYLEGNLGIGQTGDVSSDLSDQIDGWTGTAELDLEYDPALVLGGEFGFSNVNGSNFRAGLAVLFAELELDTLTITGEGTFEGERVEGSIEVDPKEFGVTFETDASLYLANVYYDFDSAVGIQPYVGAGIGMADIENTEDMELTLAGHAGFNLDLSDRTYIGVKGSVHWIGGPTDELGLEYDNFVFATAMTVFGVRF
ncbi:MAG: hypothetical protein ABJH63_08270 [Rhizobiaceae bacterium]